MQTSNVKILWFDLHSHYSFNQNESIHIQQLLQSRDAPIIGRFADNRNRPITMQVSADCYLLCIMMALDSEIIFFYRAMHFSAKRGIAIACRLSVRL